MKIYLKVKLYLVILILIVSPSFTMEFELIKNDSKCSMISGKGYINRNDEKNLEDYLNENEMKKCKIILLNSKGGNHETGLLLGRYFYENKIQTRINSSHTCASSCALAFLGGTGTSGRISMSKTKESSLVFHQLSYTCKLETETECEKYKPVISYIQLEISKLLKTKQISQLDIDNLSKRNIFKENEPISSIILYGATMNIRYWEDIGAPFEILIRSFNDVEDKNYTVPSEDAPRYSIEILDDDSFNSEMDDRSFFTKIIDFIRNLYDKYFS